MGSRRFWSGVGRFVEDEGEIGQRNITEGEEDEEEYQEENDAGEQY